MPKPDRLRVLIVEDSPTWQLALRTLIETDPILEVAAVTADGAEAVRLVAALKPDVVSMDIGLPGIDGFEATRRIMRECPVPIVVVSAGTDQPDALAFQALQAGALDVVLKPQGLAIGSRRGPAEDALLTTLKLMADIKVVRRRYTQPTRSSVIKPSLTREPAVLAIGASTGGPAALSRILRQLPGDFPLPVLVVQHIPEGFTASLVDWLQGLTPLSMQIAQHQQRLCAGQVYFAPDGHHLQVLSRQRVGLSNLPPVNGLRASVNVLFESVAQVFGRDAIGLLLTGMGTDGAAGLKAMHQRGAYTLAQDEASCVVYGMPKAAVEQGAVELLLSLDEIAATLQTLAQRT